jgi:hypothetical protein
MASLDQPLSLDFDKLTLNNDRSLFGQVDLSIGSVSIAPNPTETYLSILATGLSGETAEIDMAFDVLNNSVAFDSDLPQALIVDVLLRAEKIAVKDKDRIKGAECAIRRDVEAAEEATKPEKVDSVLKRYKELISKREEIELDDSERETYRRIMASSAPLIHTSKIDALIRAAAENKVTLGRDSHYWHWIG